MHAIHLCPKWLTSQKKTLEKFGRYIRKPYLCTRKTEMRLALLAQLVEQLTLNQWVQGSNP